MRHPRGSAFAATMVAAILGSTAASAQEVASPRAEPLRPGPPRYLNEYEYLADTDTRASVFDPIRYIALPWLAKSYLSLGGGGRFRYETVDNPVFGLPGIDSDNYYEARYELHGDLHLFDDALRTFVQIYNTDSYDKKLVTPVDESGFELYQAFVDFGFPQDGPGKGYLRVGRQEISFGEGVFFTTRLVPNVKLSFDGFRLSYTSEPGYQFQAFAVRPVDMLRNGAFNDSSQDTGDVYGLYTTQPWTENFSTDIFFVGYKQDTKTIAGMVGSETRNTFGTRLFGELAHLDYTIDLAYQSGDFEEQNIQAWGVSSSYGYTFDDLPAHPGIALRVDAASGDDNPDDNELNTFDPLFPSNGKFYGNGNYTTLANVVIVGPQFAIAPFKTLSFSPTILSLWQESGDDFVYTPALRALPGTRDAAGTHMGVSYNMFSRWTPTNNLTIDFEYQYYDVSGPIENAGGEDAQYFSVRTTFLF